MSTNAVSSLAHRTGPCTCTEYSAISPFCEYGCMIAEFERYGADCVSCPGCPLHYGDPHTVGGCVMHMRCPDPLVFGKLLNTPKARAVAAKNKLRIVPMWPRRRVKNNNAVPNPVGDGETWVDVSDSDAPPSPTNSDHFSDWASVSGETEMTEMTESVRSPSPTDTEISWLSSLSSTAPAEQTDVGYDPYEDEVDMDPEYYVYYSDDESDAGSSDGNGGGGSGGPGGGDGGDDDGDQTPEWHAGDLWTLADQYRILGESYEDYLEH